MILVSINFTGSGERDFFSFSHKVSVQNAKNVYVCSKYTNEAEELNSRNMGIINNQ